jgi:hypothetical protein
LEPEVKYRKVEHVFQGRHTAMLRQKDVYLSERVVTLRRFITAPNET